MKLELDHLATLLKQKPGRYHPYLLGWSVLQRVLRAWSWNGGTAVPSFMLPMTWSTSYRLKIEIKGKRSDSSRCLNEKWILAHDKAALNRRKRNVFPITWCYKCIQKGVSVGIHNKAASYCRTTAVIAAVWYFGKLLAPLPAKIITYFYNHTDFPFEIWKQRYCMQCVY